jgi:hypothetical protein
MYQMRCMDWPLKYIGQTGRTFKTRYKEHIQAIRNNNGNSGYSKHILKMGHTYASITNTMKVLKTERKGKLLNTLERYYMYCGIFAPSKNCNIETRSHDYATVDEAVFFLCRAEQCITSHRLTSFIARQQL